MATRGSIAKQNITTKLQEIFGEDFIGVGDKSEVFLYADDGGEKVAIKIAFTCPKTLPENLAPTIKVAPQVRNPFADEEPVDSEGLTAEEQLTVSELLAKLNL